MDVGTLKTIVEAIWVKRPMYISAMTLWSAEHFARIDVGTVVAVPPQGEHQSAPGQERRTKHVYIDLNDSTDVAATVAAAIKLVEGMSMPVPNPENVRSEDELHRQIDRDDIAGRIDHAAWIRVWQGMP